MDNKIPSDQYQELMQVVRKRLDSIQSLSVMNDNDFSKAEMAAFHGRKIIEAIAFGCLIGIKNGLKAIPKDAQGQYNAEKIFKQLSRMSIEIFPTPSEIRYANQEEFNKHDAKIVIDGIPERRITREEMIKKYQRMHNWLHELNPYTRDNQNEFHNKNQEQLWKDLNELEMFLRHHIISINGEAFYCTLKDKQDSKTKVVSLTKIDDV